jgi:hypothetical protein
MRGSGVVLFALFERSDNAGKPGDENEAKKQLSNWLALPLEIKEVGSDEDQARPSETTSNRNERRSTPVDQSQRIGHVQARRWTDITGRKSVEAEFVEEKDGKAFLRKGDGKVVGVALEKLSQEDQQYVKSLRVVSNSQGRELAIDDVKPILQELGEANKIMASFSLSKTATQEEDEALQNMAMAAAKAAEKPLDDLGLSRGVEQLRKTMPSGAYSIKVMVSRPCDLDRLQKLGGPHGTRQDLLPSQLGDAS